MNSPPPYSAQHVANSLLRLIGEKGEAAPSPMKLQKLVFFAHAWHLGLTKTPLITDTVQAWEYGPVVESLYHDLKGYQSDPITKPISGYFYDGTSLRSKIEEVRSQEILDYLANIIETYDRFTAVQLSNLSHEPGGPWDQVRNQFPDTIHRRSIPIPNELIADHFTPKKS